MVELHSFRRGYEAKNIDRLVESVLWRDINICNEIGVPALTYRPRAAARYMLLFGRLFRAGGSLYSPCVDMDVPT